MPSSLKKRDFELIISTISQNAYAATELNLSGFGLTDQDCLQLMEALSSNLFLKNNLQNLDLSNNHLESLPPCFDFPNLVNLDLQFNRIQHIEDQLRGTPSLQQLFLQQNHLSCIEELPCPNLSFLDLSNNQMQSPPKIGHLSQLVHLDLRNNLLMFPPILAETTSLQYINMSGNPIPNELISLFVSIMQNYQPMTQVIMYPWSNKIYPVISDIDELRHYCIVWAEHYFQLFAEDALGLEERKKLSQTVASAKKQSHIFTTLLINIKRSVSEQFSSSLSQFIDTLYWLIHFSGRLSPHLMLSGEAISEEAKFYGMTFFNTAWEKTWAGILEVADTMNKLSRMKERPGGAINFGHVRQPVLGDSINPFFNARLVHSAPSGSMQEDTPILGVQTGSRWPLLSEPSTSSMQQAVIGFPPPTTAQLHAFDQSRLASMSSTDVTTGPPQLKMSFS
jgi:hypothetical protein